MNGATVIEMEPCTVDGQNPCLATYNTIPTFTQNGTTGFTAGYNLAAGTGLNARWGAGTVNFLDSALFDATAGDLVIAVNDGGASYYKIDVVDAQGQKVTIRVTVDGRIAITNAILQSANVPGFDANQIKSIVIVVDDPNVTTGNLVLTTVGLSYVPVISGDPYNQALLSTLPNSPVVSSNHGTTAGGDDDATINHNQTSTTTYSVNSVIPDIGDFTFSSISWGYFDGSNAFRGTPANLGNSVTLALNGTAGRTLKVEFVSTSNPNTRRLFYVVLADGQQNFTFDLTGFGTVALINFVSDQTGVTNYTVETKGLKYIPSVTFNPALTAADISHLPSFLGLVAFNSAAPDPAATALISQSSVTQFSIIYNVANSGSYCGSISTYDNFGTNPEKEYHDLSALTNLTLGLRLAAGTGTILLELEDSNGVKRSVYLTDVDGTERFYQVALSLFSGVNLARISNINLVIVQGSVTQPNSTLEVRFGDQAYVPSIAPDPTKDADDITHFTGLVNLVSYGSQAPDPAATVTVSPLSATRFNINYNVTNGGSYGGSISTFDDFSTGPVEYQDLSALTEIVLGLRVQSGNANIEFIVEDATGNQAKVILTGVTTTENFYTINTAALASINWSQVANIVVTVTNANMTQDIGVLEVRFGDNYFIPVITGTAYNYSALTSFGAYYPGLVSGTGDGLIDPPVVSMQLTQNSSNQFEYEYDLSPSATGFTFVAISYGGTFTFPLPANQYVFAARGSDGERVKVEITDGDGDKVTFVVELSSVFQNFTLDLPADIDRLRIREIVFVQDRNIGSPLLNNFVQVQTRGLDYIATPLPSEMAEIRDTLVAKGLDYFELGAGLDPATHFPYDHITGGTAGQYTQPTLIGFYMQILGDVVRGSLNNGMTKTQALTEIQTVLTNLLSAQATYGWNGLLPWLNLGPLGAHAERAGLGDNANLAQSLAVMIGALESAGLSGADLIAAQAIATQVEQFLDNQAPGYAALVNPATGLFYGEVNTATGAPNTTYEIDRLANEFRGAVAFLVMRYPALPDTVWNNLAIVTTDSYVDRNSQNISNLAPWDGAAFQMFWPSLRNNEMDFIGFRNALYNHLVTQLDYAYQNRIPGILSASTPPEGSYTGHIGVPQVSEHNMTYNNNLLIDVGSTYALASAMNIDIYAVLGWLDSIDYLYGMNGTYGFYDSARSGSEIALTHIGIDVASTILGLQGQGGADFETYLRNRGLETGYNELYDQMSHQLVNIVRTQTTPAAAPEFPDRSFGVFGNFSSEGTVAGSSPNFQSATTQAYGVRLVYNNLGGVASGHYWEFDQTYNAQANQLFLHYSAVDSPQTVRFEFRDAANQLLYQTNVTLGGIRHDRDRSSEPDHSCKCP
jgi:hypothetical protein